MTSSHTATDSVYRMGTTPSASEAEALAALLGEAGIRCRAVHGRIGVGVEDETPSPASWVVIPGCDHERGLRLWCGVLAGRERAIDVRFAAAVDTADDGHNFFSPQSTVGREEVLQWLVDCIRDADASPERDATRSREYYWQWCVRRGVRIRCGVQAWKGYYWANSSLYTRSLDVVRRIDAIPFTNRRIPVETSAQEWAGDPDAVLSVGG